MKNLILLITVVLATRSFGQGLVQNSTLPYESIPEKADTASQDLSRKDKVFKNQERHLNFLSFKYKLAESLKVTSARIYGGGVIQSIITDEKKENVDPTGSLGFNFETKRIVFNLFYSYNTRSIFQMDSLYELGSALLQPNMSGQSFSISTYCMVQNWLAINFQSSISDDLWQINDSTKLDASPFIVSLGLRFMPFNFKAIESNKLKFFIDASFTHRSILGDFQNGYYRIGEQVVNQGGYNGFELSTNFAFNSLGLFVNYTVNPMDKYLIPGFTGSQIIFGVKLTADALTLK
jgi:hypothetical protein